ncbi:putative RNA polymerase II subunit B1 CTD phosphatase RPAP2-like protein [Bienertia sinuspersici]
MSKSDYEDVVTERTIANLCGYPLCPNSLPSERPKKGQYHISIKEHKVYDLNETYLYCCSSCLINSKAFRGSLKEDRRSNLNPSKVNEILRLFKNVGLENEDEGKKGELSSSKLMIKENAVAKGEVSMEEWIGPSNAIEGYIPQKDRLKALKNNKSYQLNDSEAVESLLDNINFTSMIISNDESTAPKKVEGSLKSGNSGARKGSKAKKSIPKKDNDSIFGGVDFMSTIITQDEYSVSKSPSSQVVSDPSQMSQEFSDKLNLGVAEKQSKLSEPSTYPAENGPQTFVDSAVIRAGNNAGQNADSSKVTYNHDQNGASSSSRHVKDESHGEEVGQLKSKSSLKNSGVKKVARSVSWADEKLNGLAGGNLCEFSEYNDTKVPSTSRGKEAAVNDDPERFASAEACAMALIEAAEAVASGQSDANDAVSKAGITVLPHPESTGEEEQSLVDDALEEVTPEKWPNKPGSSDSEFCDSDNSWMDGVPEGFSLTLSPFAMMWDALFSWLTSSSVAYIYGRDESVHEEYMSVNGREYPCKPVFRDARSLEIKQTLAGCLSRGLSELIADLKLPTVVSVVQRELVMFGLLAGNNVFHGCTSSFRMKQWQIIALLFIDALSVCRIPGLNGHLTSRRVLFAKVKFFFVDCPCPPFVWSHEA